MFQFNEEGAKWTTGRALFDGAGLTLSREKRVLVTT
jgi:hypothetical protein